MFDVEFFEDRNGVAPIKDFLIELQTKGKTSKIDRVRSTFYCIISSRKLGKYL